jgi:ABC-type molybdate transport system permease subunit
MSNEVSCHASVDVVNTFLDAVELMDGAQQRNACADAIVRLALVLPPRVAGAVFDLVVAEHTGGQS